MGKWEETAQGANRPLHKIVLDGRKHLEITGADDVISFDEGSIVLHTSMGILSVDGSALHILRLNTDHSDGVMIVEGNICGVFYVDEEAPKARGVFGRRGK